EGGSRASQSPESELEPESGEDAMDARVFEKVVASEQRLREVLGHPGERAVGKERPRLDEHCRAFIAQSPFLVLGTANASGQCDVSPKGAEPGFVKVLDETHLAIPDRLRNKRLPRSANPQR